MSWPRSGLRYLGSKVSHNGLGAISTQMYSKFSASGGGIHPGITLQLIYPKFRLNMGFPKDDSISFVTNGRAQTRPLFRLANFVLASNRMHCMGRRSHSGDYRPTAHQFSFYRLIYARRIAHKNQDSKVSGSPRSHNFVLSTGIRAMCRSQKNRISITATHPALTIAF